MGLLVKGGPVMIFILGCSVIVLGVFIDKIIHLYRAHINVSGFMDGLRNELLNRRITEAVGICENTPGPVAEVLKNGIMHFEEGKTGIKAAMQKASLAEIARMERGVGILAGIGIVSPLFGFLGTVLGLMDVFQKISLQGGLLTDPDIYAGMWQAMVTTAFGLAVAIPAYTAYNYLVGRIKRMCTDMEQAAAELTGILSGIL